MIPFVSSISLQRIAKIGRFITQPERSGRKVLAEFLKLAEQSRRRSLPGKRALARLGGNPESIAIAEKENAQRFLGPAAPSKA